MSAVRIVSVLIMLVLFVVMIASAEFVAAKLGLGDPLLYNESVAVSFSLQPNQSKSRRRGAMVTIDSYGLRSLKDWSDPSDLRILFIGDSVTYGGSYNDDSEIFSEIVCRDLRDSGLSNVTCGNAGTNGYGTDNMRARLRYSSFDNEDIIVTTIISGDPTRGMAEMYTMPLFSKSPQPFVPALTEATLFILDKVRNRFRFQRRSGIYREADLQAVEESLVNLLKTLADKQQQGKKVLLVYSPIRSEMEGHPNEQLQGLLLDILQDSKMPFIDMRPTLRQEDLDDVYFDGVHLNVYGHELYGREISRRVQELTNGS